MLSWKDLPRIFRHCVVAVHGKIGGQQDSIIRSMKIARASLQKSGYIFNEAVVDGAVLDHIFLTAKGWRRNEEHMKEGVAGDQKDLAFKELFDQIQPVLYELDGPGGYQAPDEASQDTLDNNEKTKINTRGE
jgi:hypothetical protein